MSQNVAVLPIDPSPWGRARKDRKWEILADGKKVHRILRTPYPYPKKRLDRPRLVSDATK